MKIRTQAYGMSRMLRTLLLVGLLGDAARQVSSSAGEKCDAFSFLPSANIGGEAVQVRTLVDKLRAASYSLWIRPGLGIQLLLGPDPVTTDVDLVFFRDPTTGQHGRLSLQLRIADTGASYLRIALGDNDTFTPVVVEADLLNGHWHLVTVTAHCGATAQVRVYVDGAPADTFYVLPDTCPYGQVTSPTTRLFLGGSAGADPADDYVPVIPYFGEVFGFELYNYVVEEARVARMWAECDIEAGNRVSWLDRPVFEVAPGSSVKLVAFDHRCCNRYNKRNCRGNAAAISD